MLLQRGLGRDRAISRYPLSRYMPSSNMMRIDTDQNCFGIGSVDLTIGYAWPACQRRATTTRGR